MINCTRHESFAPLRSDWKALIQQGAPATIFTTWEFQNTWWEVFGSDWHLHLLSFRDSEGLFGIAPLMERDGAFLFVGGVEVCDYLDFLALPGRLHEVIDGVFSYLLSDARGQCLDLHDLPARSQTPAIVSQLARERGLFSEAQEEDVCPRLDLPSSWEAYLQSLSKKDRHELRRKLRRLQAAGQVRYYWVNGDRPQDMADFIRLHRLSDPDKAQFMSDRMQRFFQALAETLAPTGLFRIYFLELDGVRVSATICFLQGQEMWLYNSGYDPAYGALAVGLLLKAYCLMDAINMGLKAYDFLRGREPYKYDLGAIDVPVFRQVTKLNSYSRKQHV